MKFLLQFFKLNKIDQQKCFARTFYCKFISVGIHWELMGVEFSQRSSKNSLKCLAITGFLTQPQIE